MSQTQLSIPLAEEALAKLTSKAADYGMTPPLFGAKVLEGVISNEEIMKSLKITRSSLNELIDLTLEKARTSSVGTSFMVNTFIDVSSWETLSVNEKRSVAMALASEIRKNPSRYSTLKAAGVNVYTVIKDEEIKEKQPMTTSN